MTTKRKVALLIMQNSFLSFYPHFNVIQTTTLLYKTVCFTYHLLLLLILLQMGKLWVEVCLISARGLRRSSSLWKLQWFAVGWIDPNNKYCSKIDASGNANPVWKTKFAVSIDVSESNFNDLALHVEVFSREPIFLRERLQGTATILLKEFLGKHRDKNSEVSRPGTDEVGSYQLRKKNSNKPQGFVDVSIRISEDREEPYSYIGKEGGHVDHGNSITLATGDGSAQNFPTEIPLASFHRSENQVRANSPYTHPMPLHTNYPNPPAVGPSYTPAAGPSYPPAAGPSYLPAAGPSYPPAAGPSYPPAVGPSYPPAAGPSYKPPRTPPRPPPPANVGYTPTFLPRQDRMQETYINMPSSSGAPPGRGGGPGFAMGMGAGALAAGAVIFGNDFMSGFDVPSGLQDPTLVISTDPPF